MQASPNAAADRAARTPLWVWLTIAVLSAIEPALHVWIEHFPPDGAVPTGLHVPDSAFFVHSLAMFESGYYMPYATCQSEWGDRYIGFFASTGYWLYGVVGQIGALLGAGSFYWLGLANGVCAFIYLYVAWRFLNAAVPKGARLAFVLFAIGGGPGGLLYLTTGVFGLHAHDDFERLFYPFAMYELFEGPNLSPVLHMTRLYYTVPLALGIGGLTALVTGASIRCPRHIAFSAFLIFACTVLHVRNGVFLSVAALLFLWQNAETPLAFRVRSAIAWMVAVGVGGVVYMAVILRHPTVTQNTFDTVRQSAWFVPLLLAALFYILPAAYCFRQSVTKMGSVSRVCAYAALGYFFAFAVLFAGYQVFQGNWPQHGNAAAARVVSDFALVGAAIGAVASMRKRGTPAATPHTWIVLWLLLFTCGAISAFGQGWYLQFAPQRLMAVLGLPLSIVAAMGLQSMFKRRPKLARLHLIGAVLCGLVSIAVASLFFQGSFRRLPGEGSYATFRPHWMTAHDAELARLVTVNAGYILAPPPFGDVLAAYVPPGYKPKSKVVYGLPSIQADQLAVPLEAEIRRFFSVDTGADFRAAFLEKYCVTWVYCPDTFPVDPALIEQLDAWDGLSLELSRGNGRVWLVTPEGAP